MLAAILCNLPDLVVSGPGLGYVGGATSWNKNWATDYGPDVDKAKKAKKPEVEKALELFSEDHGLPVDFERAETIAERFSIAATLTQDQKIIVMTSYYNYLRWKAIKDEETAITLLLM